MVEMPRSEQAIKVCRSHADVAKPHAPIADWTQVESVLAGYIASTIYAEAEALVRHIAAARLYHDDVDSRVRSFGHEATKKLIRSIKIGDLAKVLSLFEDGCKQHFHNVLTAKQKSDWDSLMNARHNVAHEPQDGSPAYVTLRDIDDYYDSVNGVLDLFEASLYI